MRSRLASLLRGEPTLVAAVVNIVVALGVVIGTDWTPDQVGGVVAAVVTLTSLVARHFTTPASDPTQPAVVKPTVKLGDL